MPRKARACVPCHERKVRCDAFEVGTPCTRCISADRVESCELVPQDRQRGIKRKRANRERLSFRSSMQPDGEESNPRPQNASDLLQEPLHQPPSDAGSFDPNVLNHISVNQQQSPFDSFTSGSSPTQAGEPVGEDESQLQICREMSQWQSANAHATATSPNPENKGHEIIEYHGGMSPMTILSEVLGRAPPRRLVRIVLRDPESSLGHQLEMNGLDEADVEYLKRKGALDIPLPDVCDKFLRLYFQRVYVYAPVVNRIQFMQQYRNQPVASFLLHSILASVAPYAPISLIQEAGFEDCPSAQKAFINRAQCLYDVGAEKSQLRQLQGSLILSHLHVSLYTDKDYRYWLSNATRLATKMGLHKDEMGGNIDPSLRKLLRRIWWVLYNRDALLMFNGLDNIRRMHETDFDTSELTPSDLDEEDVPVDFEDVLPRVTKLQKSFLVASCQLSLTSARLMQTMTQASAWSENTWNKLEEGMVRWREALPVELHCSAIQEWNIENFWVLVLDARSRVTECIMYRMIRDTLKSRNQKLSRRATQKLQHAMLELDTTIDRIMVHGLVEYCPMFLYNCASTILALHIERAIGQDLDVQSRLLTSLRIQTDLEFLRRLSRSWWPIHWAVQMFEVVIRRTGLYVSLAEEPAFQPGSHDPFTRTSKVGNNGTQGDEAGFDLGGVEGLGNNLSSTDRFNDIAIDIPFIGLNGSMELANSDNIFQEVLSGDQLNTSFLNFG